MSDPLVVSLKYPKSQERAPEPTPTPPPKKGKRKPRWGVLLGSLTVLLLLGVGGYLYMNDTLESLLSKARPSQSAQEAATPDEVEKEVEDIITLVSKHIVLPESEVPTIATVTEPEKLQDQPFFAHAKTGYKVLLYTGAKKAYLYDPEKDILVEVAPITTEAQ